MHTESVTSELPEISPRGRSARREALVLFTGLLAMLLWPALAGAQEEGAKLRMAHLSPDVPAVRVEVNGELVEELEEVAFGDVTSYTSLPAGSHTLAVFTLDDPSEPILEAEISPESDNAYTVAGAGLMEDGSFQTLLFQDDTNPPRGERAAVRVIHAIPDVGPAIVGVADGPELFRLPGFANASGYTRIEAGTYTLQVIPAGAEHPVLTIPEVSVEPGERYTAFAVGLVGEQTIELLLAADSEEGSVVGTAEAERLMATSGDTALNWPLRYAPLPTPF